MLPELPAAGVLRMKLPEANLGVQPEPSHPDIYYRPSVLPTGGFHWRLRLPRSRQRCRHLGLSHTRIVRWYRERLTCTVHDELVLEVPEELAEEYKTELEQVMIAAANVVLGHCSG